MLERLWQLPVGLVVLFGLAPSTLTVPALPAAAPTPRAETPTAVTIVVGLRDGGRVDVETLARDHGLAWQRSIVSLDAVVLVGTAAPRATLDALEGDPRVRHASLDIPFRIAAGCCDAAAVEDPTRELASTRAEVEATYGELQRRAGERQGTLVAVLDTGVDAGHPDLAGALVAGRSFVVGERWDEDRHGHGTAMTSLVAARRSDGLRGVAPGVQVLPVQVAGADGSATLADVAAGLAYAVERGAEVVLISLGAGHPAPLLDDALALAEERGVLVVAAAGNANTHVDLHPAADPRVLSVGCIDDDGLLATHTTLAPTTDLLAPGVAALVAKPHRGYARVTGSSVSAARVAGVAALTWEAAPDASAAGLRGFLRLASRTPDVFVADPDLARAFPVGVLEPGLVLDALDHGNPGLRLRDPRVLPARAVPGDPVSCSVRIENPGLHAAPPGVLTIDLGGQRTQAGVPGLAPGESRVIQARFVANAPGEVAFRCGPRRATCRLAAAEVPVRDLAVTGLVAHPDPRGGLALEATVEGRGLAEGGRLEVVVGDALRLGSQVFPALGPGDLVTLRFVASPEQVARLPRGVLQARAALVGRLPDDHPRDDLAWLDLEAPTTTARTSYQQNGQVNVIADAPFRLEPGRGYLPLLVFAAEKGDTQSSTWLTLDRVTIAERTTPAAGAGGPGRLLYRDEQGGATTAPMGLVVLDEEGRPTLRAGQPDPRLFAHQPLLQPGRYAILRLPRDAFGIPPQPAQDEVRFLDVSTEWTTQRRFLAVPVSTSSGRFQRVLRVTFAARPRPRLPGEGHYYDAHVHTISEWYQDVAAPSLAPRKALGGPIPMVAEAAWAIGLTDAVDAVHGRLVTTDHNNFYNPGDSVVERPAFGPTSVASSAGRSEFDQLRHLLGFSAGEEVTFAADHLFQVTSGVQIPVPTGAHLLSYRAAHVDGPWHGGSATARQLGDPSPDVELADVLGELAQGNRTANSQAAAFAAHPYSSSLGWSVDDFELAFERDPARRTDRVVHAEGTGFVTKGVQVWNNDSGRHVLPSGRIDLANLNPWADSAFTRGNANWDSLLYRGLGDYHQLLGDLLDYELRGRPGVRFPRKLFILAGNDAHGDFNFTVSRGATILSQTSSIKVNHRSFGRVVTYAMGDGQPAATAAERAFEAMLDGNSVLTDGPLAVLSVDAEDRFHGQDLVWHDAQPRWEDRDGRIGGGGAFDGLGTALVQRGSTHVRYGYRYTNTPEFGERGGDVVTLNLYRTSAGDPNPLGQKPNGRPLLEARGSLAPLGPDRDLDEALDPAQEGVLTTTSALQLGAFTGDPADMPRDDRRSFTNPVWCVPYDVSVDVTHTTTDPSGRGVIPPGALRVAFTCDMSLEPGAWSVELKALDAAGTSSDRGVGPIDELVPVGAGWSDAGAVKNARYEVTNQRSIPLDLDRYPAPDRVTFVVYTYTAPRDAFGNPLHAIAATFEVPGQGTGGGTGPAVNRGGAPSSSTAPPATGLPPAGGASSGGGGGGCALTSAAGGRPPWLGLGLLLLVIALSRATPRSARGRSGRPLVVGAVPALPADLVGDQAANHG
jgi:Subtilase family